MSLLPSLLLFALLTLQLQRSSCEERRTDVMRAVLSGPAEPGFWPSRGRRDGSSEEQPPPFWAHRGRATPCESKYLLLQHPVEQESWKRSSELRESPVDLESSWLSRGRKRSAER